MISTTWIHAILLHSILFGGNASPACAVTGVASSENALPEQSIADKLPLLPETKKDAGLQDDVSFIQRTMSLNRNDKEPSGRAVDDVAAEVRTMSADDRAALQDL